MKSQSQVFEKLKEIKASLNKDYSVKEIGVFGSFSQNNFSDESDVDILVEFERPIGWKFFTLELYLQQVLGRKVDLVTKNALKKQVRESILSQVIYV